MAFFDGGASDDSRDNPKNNPMIDTQTLLMFLFAPLVGVFIYMLFRMLRIFRL